MIRKSTVVARLVEVGLPELQQIVRNGARVKLTAEHDVTAGGRRAAAGPVETLDEDIAAQLQTGIQSDADEGDAHSGSTATQETVACQTEATMSNNRD